MKTETETKKLRKTETKWKRENLKRKLIKLAKSVSFPLYFRYRIGVVEIEPCQPLAWVQ